MNISELLNPIPLERSELSIQDSSRILPPPLSCFHRFPNLPAELQFMIWDQAMPPRIMKLKTRVLPRCEHAMVRVRSDVIVPDGCVDHRSKFRGTCCTGFEGMLSVDIDELTYDDDLVIHFPHEDLVDDLWAFHTNLPTPSVLSACQDSRNIALKRYKPGFLTLGAPAQILFDFERDTLFLECKDESSQLFIFSEHLFSVDDAYKVQNLAILVPHGGNHFRYIFDLLLVFDNLKNLTLVMQHYRNPLFEKQMSDEDREKELAFIDAIDIDDSISKFTSASPSGVILRGIDGPNVDRRSLLEWIRARLLPLGIDFTFRMDNIDRKIITTATMKDRLNEMRRDYEQRTGFVCHQINDIDQSTTNPALCTLNFSHSL